MSVLSASFYKYCRTLINTTSNHVHKLPQINCLHRTHNNVYKSNSKNHKSYYSTINNKQRPYPIKPKLTPHKHYRPLSLNTLTATLTVPSHIERPEYALDGTLYPSDPRYKQYEYRHGIEIKTPVQIDLMRQINSLVSYVRYYIHRYIKPGVTTDELDKLVHKKIIELGAYPSPLFYAGFPKSCCTSINHVVCHGIPDTTVVQDGDILNIDISAYMNGMHGDCSGMYIVGNTDTDAHHLINTTNYALQQAISICKPDQPINVIGSTIQDIIEQNNLKVVEQFCGHGIGHHFHIPPLIRHFRNHDDMTLMKPGMVFTIEPAVCEGSNEIETCIDGWTIVTLDGSRAAQWEETIVITETGAEILTQHKIEDYEQ